MEKSKRQTSISFFLESMIGGKGQIGLVRMFARLKYKSSSVSVPSRLNCAEKILIILPEDSFMALQQVETVVSIVSQFSQIEVVLFSEQSIASYFKKIKGITSIITYAESERFLFSRDFRTYGKMLSREEFDVLFFLERTPHPALLNLVVQSDIPLRIGYEGTAEFPFFNFRVRPSAQRTYIGDQNLYLLEALNIPLQKKIRWSVSKQGMEELQQLLLEHRIDSDVQMLLVDINHLYRLGGKEWTQQLLENLQASFPNEQICLYASDTSSSSFVTWLQNRSIPVLSDLSSSRIAALVGRCSVVIAGKSLLFQLARLLGVCAVGMFTQEEASVLFVSTSQSRAVVYSQKPDDEAVQGVIESVRDFV